MSDSISSQLSGTQVGVHAGSGDVNIFYGVSLKDSTGRSPRKQAADDLWWLLRHFVHPVGFGKARDVLESHRTVFLDAPPGSGRISAAKVLLWELRRDTEKFHELLPQEEGSKHRLDLSHIGDGDRVWLNLSDVKGPLWSEIRVELPSLRNSVHEHAAHLVVVLPDKTEDLQPEFYQYRVKITRRPDHEVLRRYLRLAGIPQSEPLPPLQYLDSGRSLQEIARYAELIADVRDEVSGQGDLAAWCDTAHRVLSGQEQGVAELVARLHQGSQRALLLATAMLHGAHADSIHRASTSLLRTLEHPLNERPILVHTPLDHRLEEIGAKFDASGNVRFKELDYDSAVRSYFWTRMPGLHDHIQEWVGRTVDSADLIDGEWEELVGRFTEQCLNDRYRSAWASLVEQWTARPPTSRRMKAAALVLQRGLRDEKCGRIFRKQIYDWSCKNNLPDGLAEVIIVACREQMVVSHPDEAVVRLHHMARRERGTRAREALVGLVGGDSRFLRQMLNRLTDQSPDRRNWSADADIFLELADPIAITDPGTRNHALITESGIYDQLVLGWNLAFANPSHEAWSPRVRQWLSLAAGEERYRNVLLDVLVAGGEPRTEILGRLYDMTRVRELRAIISDLMLQKIDAAQGVQYA